MERMSESLESQVDVLPKITAEHLTKILEKIEIIKRKLERKIDDISLLEVNYQLLIIILILLILLPVVPEKQNILMKLKFTIKLFVTMKIYRKLSMNSLSILGLNLQLASEISNQSTNKVETYLEN
jgi:hypothetical protein